MTPSEISGLGSEDDSLLEQRWTQQNFKMNENIKIGSCLPFLLTLVLDKQWHGYIFAFIWRKPIGVRQTSMFVFRVTVCLAGLLVFTSALVCLVR